MRTRKITEPLILDGIHSSGKSICHYNGKNIYIEFGIPGETVEISLDTRKRGFYSGKVTGVVHPSEKRADPFCMHFGYCGGCNWQHMQYALQLQMKRQILINALNKYGISFPEIPTVIPSPKTSFFRHRLEYTFSTEGWIPEIEAKDKENSESVLGFHLIGEPNKIIGIRECYLQAEPSRKICETIVAFALENKLTFYNHKRKTGLLRSLSIRNTLSGETMVIVGFAEDAPELRKKLFNHLREVYSEITGLCWTIYQSDEHSQMQGVIHSHNESSSYLFEHLGGFSFRIHATSFFQPNPMQAEQVFSMARDWSGLTGREKVIDLYTGIGTIALFLAPYAREVLGIEGSAAAIDDARENARLNGIRNVNFMTGDILQTFTSAFLEEKGKPDLIVLDPPRSGTLIEIKKTMLASGAQKILYLSCNPVSLAFDLKQLTEGYRVNRIQPFDMLPHTHQLETLVLLEKKPENTKKYT